MDNLELINRGGGYVGGAGGGGTERWRDEGGEPFPDGSGHTEAVEKASGAGG